MAKVTKVVEAYSEGVASGRTVKVVTNGAPRQVLDWTDLTPKEQARFAGHKDRDRLEAGDFIRFMRKVYFVSDLHYCLPTTALGKEGWHGSDSFDYKSGMVVKYVNRHDVVCGRYYIEEK